MTTARTAGAVVALALATALAPLAPAWANVRPTSFVDPASGTGVARSTTSAEIVTDDGERFRMEWEVVLTEHRGNEFDIELTETVHRCSAAGRCDEFVAESYGKTLLTQFGNDIDEVGLDYATTRASVLVHPDNERGKYSQQGYGRSVDLDWSGKGIARRSVQGGQVTGERSASVAGKIWGVPVQDAAGSLSSRV